MRILAISHLFPHPADPQLGIFAARQFAAFQKLGSETIVLFPTIKIPVFLQYFKKKWGKYDEKHRPLTDYGLNVIQVPCVRLSKGIGFCRWDGLILYLAIKRQILRLHEEKPFDIIYGRGLFPGADTAGCLSKLLKIPAVGVAIGGDVNQAPNHNSTMRRHFLKVIQRLDGILANGQGLADKIKAVSGRDCQTAHGVVDLDVFCPVQNKIQLRNKLGIPRDALAMLYVGNLIKQKGLYELLEAFEKTHKKYPHTVLNICGKGVEYEGLRKLILQRSLSDAVRLAGQIVPTKIHQWMQASDIFVFPSYMEGMPNAVMEAMACGLPVISTTVGGLPDAIGNCEGAILVEPNNVEQLASAIQKVCDNTEQYKKMSLIARRTAEEKFSLEKNVKKTLNYLDKIIAQSK